MDLPDHVDHKKWLGALRELGIPTKGLIRLEATPTALTVTHRRRDDADHPVIIDGRIATSVTEIRIGEHKSWVEYDTNGWNESPHLEVTSH